MFLCDRITPLGTPVEPLVYIIMAGSSGRGAAEDKVDCYREQNTYCVKIRPTVFDIRCV